MTHLSDIFNASEGAKVVDVTPEMASDLLEKTNFQNRKVRPIVVKRYAKLMRDGDWKFSPETISISKSGRLLNGQHRMLAVVQSGVTCRFLFATGFDEEVFSVLDRGATRNRSDALQIDQKLAQTGSLLARIYNSAGSYVVTDADVARASERIRDAHGDLLEFCNTSKRMFTTAPFRLAAVARIMGGSDPHYVFTTYRNLALSHTENLPPIGHAAIRAFMTGRLFSGGGKTQINNLCSAWKVFDPRAAQTTKLSIVTRQESLDAIVEATGYVST